MHRDLPKRRSFASYNLQDSNIPLWNMQDSKLLSCNLQGSSFLLCNLEDSNFLWCNLHERNFVIENLVDGDIIVGWLNFGRSYLWWFRNLACCDLFGINRIEKELVHGPPGLVWGKVLVWLSVSKDLIWSGRETEGLVLIFLSFAVL